MNLFPKWKFSKKKKKMKLKNNKLFKLISKDNLFTKKYSNFKQSFKQKELIKKRFSSSNLLKANKNILYAGLGLGIGLGMCSFALSKLNLNDQAYQGKKKKKKKIIVKKKIIFFFSLLWTENKNERRNSTPIIFNTNTVADIVERVSPSCVSITNQMGMTHRSTGSGFIIDKNGTIVTCNHVVEGSPYIYVYLNDGIKREAKVVAMGKKNFFFFFFWIFFFLNFFFFEFFLNFFFFEFFFFEFFFLKINNLILQFWNWTLMTCQRIYL